MGSGSLIALYFTPVNAKLLLCELFSNEVRRHSGSFCIRILAAGSITFHGERSNNSNFLALPSKTFLLCHRKLSCLSSKTFPLCHRKLSCFVIENFPALSSKTFMLCHRKLSCFVILSVVRRQPNGAEGPHARVQRPWPVQASPTTTPTAL
jgi:hypothetical protein